MNTAELAIADLGIDVFDQQDMTSHTLPSRATGTIPKGQRNATLASMAGRMCRVGLAPGEIAAALRVRNQQCTPPLSDREVEAIATSIGERYAPAVKERAPLVGFTLEALGTHTFPARKALFTRGDAVVLREGHLAAVHGLRGIGKTLLLQTLEIAAAAGVEVLGFRAAEPCNVLRIDGEMASRELQERYLELQSRLGVPSTIPLTIVAADWQDGYLPRLDTPEGQDAIEPFIEAAQIISIDNRSCLFNPEAEKDAVAWQPAQDWLLSLRRRGKAVLLGHHSNRLGGARGHSKAEDILDVMIGLTRPEDYSQDQGARFLATFEKCRGAHGAGVAPFLAQLTPEGWQLDSPEREDRDVTADRLLEYVRLATDAGEPPKTASAAIAGARVRRAAGLAAWANLTRAGAILKHTEGGFYAP